ncbi:hypothetical protein P154DRAFT_535900 [Amniculicola lignicola CBS 123094]|uniref:Uncharacterized protein n=1 Tax=Amniculicola lignicola CBS 123094 TaxID=1392246 RepID=A0A6A5WFU6_9PLEO|nr:hypothetical protein P154DRAFT_535900 [Amniculicola lignicola CBS 123094]
MGGSAESRGNPHARDGPSTPPRQRGAHGFASQHVTASAPAKGVGIGLNMDPSLNPRAPTFGRLYPKFHTFLQVANKNADSFQAVDYNTHHNTPTKQASGASPARGPTLGKLPTVDENTALPASSKAISLGIDFADTIGSEGGGNSSGYLGGESSLGSDSSTHQLVREDKKASMASSASEAPSPSGPNVEAGANPHPDSGARNGSSSSSGTGHMTHSTDNVGHDQTPNADNSNATAKGRPIINITTERNHFKTVIPPAYVLPTFLQHIPNALDTVVYHNQTIPYLQAAIFVITCMPDLNYFRHLLGSPLLPNLWLAVSSIDFNGFHWFSGISKDRNINPYLAFASSLPNLTEIKLTFHTASFTVSAIPERERIRLENLGQFEESKALKALRGSDVIKFYGLPQVFHLQNLKVVKMECIQSAMVSHFCRQGNPMTTWHELACWN